MKSKEQAALGVLHNTGIDILEAALVAKAALKAAHGRVKRALKCIAAGENALKQQERTVSFEKAVAAALEARKDRRTRTLYDFRYFTRRFMKRCPGLARRKVRSITPQECAAFIETAFDTPRHSKTGGARRVTIHKPLMRILRTHRRSDDEKISPANWPYHWRELRRASGCLTAAHALRGVRDAGRFWEQSERSEDIVTA